MKFAYFIVVLKFSVSTMQINFAILLFINTNIIENLKTELKITKITFEIEILLEH